MARNGPDEERNQSFSRSGVPRLNNGPSGGCGGDAEAALGRRQLAIQEFHSLQLFRLGLDRWRTFGLWTFVGMCIAAGSQPLRRLPARPPGQAWASKDWRLGE